ncbi:MAG TPA: AAA family ATPase [Acetobacteraceae bacterium]|nr:AAA family ATPase [Acetobacteraceae bacterium]
MDCPRCGASAPEGQRFCSDCGTPLAPWRCAACGADNAPGRRFCGDCGSVAGGAAVRSGPATTPTGERRQLTVMFCDMVDSTALGARLDPEDLRDVVATYHRCVTEHVTRFGGFLARYMGDGVLVYFGYPAASEDDTERAVRAGLAAVKAVSQLDTVAGPPSTLQARVGIATGLVIVGHRIGSGASLEQAVVGDAPNLAARLQTLAQPGTVIIADSAQRLTGGLFEYRDHGAREMKGYATPVRAWTVLRESATDSRFEALRSGGQVLRSGGEVPLFGRDEQLALLLHRWDQVRQGKGHVILLSGQEGIGKSRLAAALEDRLQSEPHTRRRYQCSPNYRDSALHPIIAQTARAAGFEREDDAATKLRKLEAVLPAGASQDDFALLADLLSLPAPPDSRIAGLTPQLRKERTFAAILRQLENLARDKPVLAIFEDLHWADPTSLELLTRVIEQIERMKVLLVITTRPDPQPAWIDRPEVSVQLLGRLDHRQATSLIDGVTGGSRLPDAVREQIIAHADGVPLFVEELTKTVLESGTIRHDSDHAVIELRPHVVVPSSLQASLTARLDRLAGVKEVAQMGSVIGREFSFELFQLVFDLPHDRLTGSLQALVAADLIVGRGRPPNAAYSFKHALVQETAYSSLLRDRRRALHLQVAEGLERDERGIATAEPELLAYHFAEAGIADRAIDYHLKAAEHAMARCALTEMVSHLRRGLGLLSSLPASPETSRRELLLQVALGRGLIDQVGSASEQGHAAFLRARELSLELDSTEFLLPVLYGLQVYHFSRSEPAVVSRYAREILELGQRTGNRQVILLGERVGGSAYLVLGRFAEARAAYERVLALYEKDQDADLASNTMRDPFVVGCAFLAIGLTVMGYPEQGAETSQRGLSHAEHLGHAISSVFGLRRGCIAAMLRRDVDLVKTMSGTLLEVSIDYETFLGGTEAQLFQSWALLHEHDDPALRERLRQSLDRIDAARVWTMLPFMMAASAELLGTRGDRDAARTLLARAVELVRLTDEQWCQPEIMRLEAEFLCEDPEEEAGMLRRSIELSHQMGAHLWGLRSAIDLARLLRDEGRRNEARDLLTPIYGWFTEGFEARDLQTARGLLETLG